MSQTAHFQTDTKSHGISGIMSVDNNMVRHIARLARIAVRDEELDGLSRELNAILDWVEQLDAVDTSEVAPMTRVVVPFPRIPTVNSGPERNSSTRTGCP